MITASINIRRLMHYLGNLSLLGRVLSEDGDRIWAVARKDRNNLHQWCEYTHQHQTTCNVAHCEVPGVQPVLWMDRLDPFNAGVELHRVNNYTPSQKLAVYREAGAVKRASINPFLQITFHMMLGEPPWLVEIRNIACFNVPCLLAEIEIVYLAPESMLGLSAVWHWLTNAGDNQDKISRALDKRIGKEAF